MRFKKYSFEKKIFLGKKIKHLCKKNNVKFIVNDDPILAKKLNADGCHLGQKDTNIKDYSILSVHLFRRLQDLPRIGQICTSPLIVASEFVHPIQRTVPRVFLPVAALHVESLSYGRR